MSQDNDLKPLLDSFRWRGRPAPLKAVVRVVEAADRWAFIVIVLIAVTAFWLPPALRATGLNLSAPIDDIWIHAQNARCLAQGRLSFESPAAGYSPAATSALYPAALAAGWFVGFRGQAIMIFALLLNLAGLAVFLRAAMQLVWRSGGRAATWLAPPLIVLNGPLLWSVFSGMETGFCAGLIGGFLLALHRDFRRPSLRGPRPLTLLLAALMPLARPDWLLLAAPMLASVCFMHRARWRARSWLISAIVLLPLAVWFTSNRFVGGTFPLYPIGGSFNVGTLAARIFWTPIKHLLDVYGLAGLALIPAAGLSLAGAMQAPTALLLRFRFDIALLASTVPSHLWIAATHSDPATGYYQAGVINFALLIIVGLRISSFALLRLVVRHPALRLHLVPASILTVSLLMLIAMAKIPAIHTDYMQRWVNLHNNQISLGKLLASRRNRMPELQRPIAVEAPGAVTYFAGGDYISFAGHDPAELLASFSQLPPARRPSVAVLPNHLADTPLAGDVLIRRVPPPSRAGNADLAQWLSVYRIPEN